MVGTHNRTLEKFSDTRSSVARTFAKPFEYNNLIQRHPIAMLIIVAARENAKAMAQARAASSEERRTMKECILFTAHSIETSKRETPA